MTLEELLKTGIQILQDAGVEEARLDAWLLLEYISGYSRAGYYACPERILAPEKARQYLELIRKRALRIPLQHLTCQAFFMGHEFYVDKRVLIPRQDTEILAELAIESLKGKESPRFLDLCTGSGCILISVLLALKTAVGDGTDISEDALAVAKENALRLGVADRASFIRSDLFSAPIFLQNSKGDGKEAGKYDMIVSNPPYIASGEIESLAPEVRLHDPRLALDGGKDGLFLYRRIIRDAGKFLKDGARILMEMGASQGEAVSSLLSEAGFKEIRIYKDLAGLDRVAGAYFHRNRG